MKDEEESEEAAEKAEPAEAEHERAEEPEGGEEAEATEEAAAEGGSAAPEPAPIEAEKPVFTNGWPPSADLDRLLAAFERGNYAYVRSEAPKVAERASDPAVKAAALDLRKRIDPAPLAGILIFVAVGLLVVLAGHYLGKHNPGAPPTVPPASTNAPLQPPAPK